LCAEASQQVGYATWQPDNFPRIVSVEEEKLILLLKMQMMRIGQPKKEQDCHTEKECAKRT
jgi:hypothetical protein